jgi:hypothetical protein
MREQIRDLPNGTWHTQDYIDADPNKEEGFVTVDVEMAIEGDEVHYDLSGSYSITTSTSSSPVTLHRVPESRYHTPTTSPSFPTAGGRRPPQPAGLPIR